MLRYTRIAHGGQRKPRTGRAEAVLAPVTPVMIATSGTLARLRDHPDIHSFIAIGAWLDLVRHLLLDLQFPSPVACFSDRKIG